ncbi:MAG TPA: methionine--tRNA ligase [Actinobacteria bacterium]|nr:methionine--tRNA ligase [bacterium BMS3Bbin01]HDH27149.1 methionine--tRNA ligase [Actinomycetota bacterium]
MSGSRHILVAVAWPYASGSRHLGHLSGAYLPADIFARYHRLAGNQVLMVSGSDVHGTPITVRADQEGVEPAVIVDRYHQEFLSNWKSLGISWDLYTTTGTDNHREVTWDVFRRLHEHGYIVAKSTPQFYDAEAERFLPDRYVEGTCPFCGYTRARGDQCDDCGRQLDPEDLIDPRSRFSGTTPVMRETEHYFLRLSAFEERLLAWLESRQGWRKHVQNMAIGFTKDGLHDRAITRDLTWGIPLPPEFSDLGEGKRIYVWFEAVIGYLSAAKEWAQRTGDPQAWQAWWEDPEAESYYFIGKDNVVFHAVIWPCQLMGYEGLNLPTDVPANQYVTFKGEKGSASRGIGRSITWYTERLEPDALRYALAASLPEQNDTDLSDDEIVRRINEELVATWGNLVNRVLNLTARSFDGMVPTPGTLAAEDRELLDTIDRTLSDEADLIEHVELRSGLRTVMQGAQAVNAYLNAQEPWKVIKQDRQRAATILWTALSAIAGLGVGFLPYLPFTSARLHDMLGLKAGKGGLRRPDVPEGARLGEIGPLFTKLDDTAL